MPLAIDALDHLVINVRDVEVAAAWYQRVLQMDRVPVTFPHYGAEESGYAVLLAPEHGMGAVRAHVMIKVGPKESRAVTAALRSIPQVRVLHSVSGDADLIAVAATASVTEMDEVIDRIGALDGVERTTSSIILSTKFER